MIEAGAVELPEGPVLVIAPHPDDETLGCGGLIAACVRQGRKVHTVFVTDGGASHANSQLWSCARLAARREAEATEALRRLGAGAEPRTFLRLGDAAMPRPGTARHSQAVAAVAAILCELDPELVVLPWRRDPHCDHRASWSLVMEAMSLEARSSRVLEYAIWLEELGGDGDWPLDEEMERMHLTVSAEIKKYAIEAHGSQLGAVVPDDPQGFVLSRATLDRLTSSVEVYWRPCSAL